MANVSSFSGAMPVIPGGTVELGYAEITSSVTISSTTAGSGTTIFSDLSFVSDGSPILVELFSPQARPSLSADASITVSLYLDGSEQTRTWGRHRTAAGTNGDSKPLNLSRRITPSAGSHTVSVKAYASTGSGSFGAGTGTSTTDAPAFLRVSKIVNQNDGLKPFWTPPIVTQLPSNATVGDQVIYAADATNGVYWSLYYDGIGTYPWKFVGGGSLFTQWTAGFSTSSTGWTTDTAFTGFSIPLAGDYLVTSTCMALNTTAFQWWLWRPNGCSYPTSDSSGVRVSQANNGNYESATRSLKATLTTGTLNAVARVVGANGTFIDRSITAIPVRVAA